jgi:hypothetical protein
MEDNWLEDVKAEADVSVIPTEEKLSRLAELAREQRRIEGLIEDLKVQAEQARADLSAVSEKHIPELMTEIGISEFKLSNGLKVSIKPYYSGKITDDKAYVWLEENGYGDLVKSELIIKSRRTDKDILHPVYDLLAQMDIDFTEKEGVHYMTLSAFLKEAITTGVPIDRELFNVFTGWKTTIK